MGTRGPSLHFGILVFVSPDLHFGIKLVVGKTGLPISVSVGEIHLKPGW